jgi:hypothetical protein
MVIESELTQRLSSAECKGVVYGAVEVLAECIPSPRLCLSPCTPVEDLR